MEQTTCLIRTVVNGEAEYVAKIKVRVVPRIGEKIRITKKARTLHDWEVTEENEWIVDDICHELMYPYENANETFYQTIVLYVRATSDS